MEYYSAIKRMMSSLGTTRIYLKGIMLSKISQTEKDKYHLISLICGILKNKTSEQNRNRCIDTEKPEGRRTGKEVKPEKGLKYKLLVVK